MDPDYDWLACTRILALSFFLPQRNDHRRNDARGTILTRRERERERERERHRGLRAYISASVEAEIS